MIELYQFELSQFSEKVRLILDYKGLDYRKIEVTPGIGQLELMQMSGQRQVPVLKDGETIVSDSTEIAMYLERQYPEPALIPSDLYQKGLCLMMEEWADESLGLKGRKALIGAIGKNTNLRSALLPADTPDFVKGMVEAVPPELFDALNSGIGALGEGLKEAESGLRQDLEALCLILKDRQYLVGDTPTLADFAVAGLTMAIKFPNRPYLDIPEALSGKGIPGLGDNSAYDVFFEWRERLYTQFRKPSTRPLSSGSADAPTAINIE